MATISTGRALHGGRGRRLLAAVMLVVATVFGASDALGRFDVRP